MKPVKMPKPKAFGSAFSTSLISAVDGSLLSNKSSRSLTIRQDISICCGKAHQELNKAVDLCYRPQPFQKETKRIEFLFELYDKYTAGMFAGEKNGKKKR
jgi:hypothetical protein